MVLEWKKIVVQTIKLLIITFALIIIVNYFFDKRNENLTNEKKEEELIQSKKEENKLRYSAWAYIEKQKQLSETESFKQIILPGKYGEHSDDRCLVYTNTELHQIAMVCGELHKTSK